MKELTPPQWFEVQEAKIEVYVKLMRHLEALAAEKDSPAMLALRDLTAKNVKAAEANVFDLLDNPSGPEDYAKMREIWGERRANATLLTDIDSAEGKIENLKAVISNCEAEIAAMRGRQNVTA